MGLKIFIKRGGMIMYKYNVSIIIPGTRHEQWVNLYDSLKKAIGKYSFELIIVGPLKPDNELLEKDNFQYIPDYGHPARCTQIGSLACSGELMTWGSDDGTFLEDGLELAIDLWYQNNNPKDQVILKYLEGPHPYMPDMTDTGLGYWHAWFHDDLKLASIPKHYMVAPIGLMTLEYFRFMGGFDCEFENINMCCNDLAFRIQYDGGQLHLPPKHVTWHTWSSGDGGIVVESFHEHDNPLFKKIYSDDKILENRRYLDYNNWIYNTEPIWLRRFDIPNMRVKPT